MTFLIREHTQSWTVPSTFCRTSSQFCYTKTVPCTRGLENLKWLWKNFTTIVYPLLGSYEKNHHLIWFTVLIAKKIIKRKSNFKSTVQLAFNFLLRQLWGTMDNERCLRTGRKWVWCVFEQYRKSFWYTPNWNSRAYFRYFQNIRKSTSVNLFYGRNKNSKHRWKCMNIWVKNIHV